MKTIFDKIIKKEIPAKIIYEDALCMAFHDINPVAKFHALLIPKEKNNLDGHFHAEEKNVSILGHLMWKAKEIAE